MRNSLVALGAGAGLVGVLAIGGVVAASGDRPPDLGERIVVPPATATPGTPVTPTPTPTTTPTTSPKRSGDPSPADTGGREVPPPTPPGSDDDGDDDANDPDDADDLDDN